MNDQGKTVKYQYIIASHTTGETFENRSLSGAMRNVTMLMKAGHSFTFRDRAPDNTRDTIEEVWLAGMKTQCAKHIILMEQKNGFVKTTRGIINIEVGRLIDTLRGERLP